MGYILAIDWKCNFRHSHIHKVMSCSYKCSDVGPYFYPLLLSGELHASASFGRWTDLVSLWSWMAHADANCRNPKRLVLALMGNSTF